MIRKSFTGLLGLVWATTATADWALNMPEGVTELSAETYDLHMLAFWVCTAIGVLVFGAMIVSLISHRKSKGAVAAEFSHSTTAEVTWTTIPVLILLAMAIPAARTMIKLEDTRDPDLTVVVTGFQWRWHYRYQDQEVAFYSSLARPSLEARQKDSGIDPFGVENYLLEVDRPLVVPVGAKVRVLLTSNDVLHAWWVPGPRRQERRRAGHGQRDLVPRRAGRHLPRTMRGALRQGPWLHAGRRGSRRGGRLRRLARRKRRQACDGAGARRQPSKQSHLPGLVIASLQRSSRV